MHLIEVIYQKEVIKIMESELIKLGLITSYEVQKQDSKNPLYKKYFMQAMKMDRFLHSMNKEEL